MTISAIYGKELLGAQFARLLNGYLTTLIDTRKNYNAVVPERGIDGDMNAAYSTIARETARVTLYEGVSAASLDIAGQMGATLVDVDVSFGVGDTAEGTNISLSWEIGDEPDTYSWSATVPIPTFLVDFSTSASSEDLDGVSFESVA